MSFVSLSFWTTLDFVFFPHFELWPDSQIRSVLQGPIDPIRLSQKTVHHGVCNEVIQVQFFCNHLPTSAAIRREDLGD